MRATPSIAPRALRGPSAPRPSVGRGFAAAFAWGIAAALALPSGGAAQAFTPEPVNWDVTFSGSYPTRVSGLAPGDPEVLERFGGLPGRFRFGEWRDGPCRLEVEFVRWMDFEAAQSGPSHGSERFDECRQHAGDRESLSIPDGHAVTAIRVCHRAANARLKGVEVRYARVTPTGLGATGTATWERRNCNQWMPDFVTCPDGMVARGVRVHADGPDVQGLGLVCARLEFTVSEWTQPPALTQGAGSDLLRPRLTVLAGTRPETAVSGDEANRAVIAGGPHAVIEGVEFRERNDRPCWLRVDFRTHRPDVQRTSQTFDRCGGAASGGRSVRIGDVSSEFRMVSGLVVCQRRQNERLKGIRVYGATVTPTLGVRHDDALTDVRERANCNDWRPRVSCPANQVGKALLVHFRSTPGAPDEIVGLALRCAGAEADVPSMGG